MYYTLCRLTLKYSNTYSIRTAGTTALTYVIICILYLCAGARMTTWDFSRSVGGGVGSNIGVMMYSGTSGIIYRYGLPNWYGCSELDVYQPFDYEILRLLYLYTRIEGFTQVSGFIMGEINISVLLLLLYRGTVWSVFIKTSTIV